MLIRFFVNNYLSFKSSTELNLFAGKQRIHPNHISSNNVLDFRILRSSVIYGPNASGKSNLVKAMAFAKSLIVNGTQQAKNKINVRPFLLDKESQNKPSTFQFDFIYKEKAYTYGFTVTSDYVVKEWLDLLTKVGRKNIFTRQPDVDKKTTVEIASFFIDESEREFINFVAKSTRPNQLFLTQSIESNVDYFSDVYEWFDDILTIIFPDSKAHGIEFLFQDKENIAPTFSNILSLFDTGISKISSKEYLLENIPDSQIPEKIKLKLQDEIKNPKEKVFIGGSNGKNHTIYRNEKDELVAIKLFAEHKIQHSSDTIPFDFSDESDGTQRIVDLLPALSSLMSSNQIFVIDEINRSLHPHIAKTIFDLFLNHNNSQDSQLIATTHEAIILDFKLMRKDEIWFINKNEDGESELYSLEEFNPRYDKDILNGYLNGRFGAIPRITLNPDLNKMD